MPAHRSADTPFLGDGSDSFRPPQAPHTLRVGADPDISGLVTSALTAMAASGDTAEDAYLQTLVSLRERAEDVVAALGATYSSLEEDRYLERWSLVQLLTDLRARSAVDVLTDVLRQPIPEERSAHPAHGLSTVGEEMIIRTTAVEALARLVAEGDRPAREALLAQLRHEALSVRRAVVQAVMDSGDQQLRIEVAAALKGTADEWLLGLRRADVRDVPQADGRQFLRERDPEDSSTPPDPMV